MEREEFVSKVSEIANVARDLKREVHDLLSIELNTFGNFRVHLYEPTFKTMFNEYKEEFHSMSDNGKDVYKIFVVIDGVEYFALEYHTNEYEEK